MRKLFSAFISIPICLLFILEVSAHPGGTDADGGHWDYDAGEYHYHHGYTAHSHYDMDGDGAVDCPYDFKDRTGSQSGTSTGGTSYSSRSYNDSSNTRIVTVYEDREVIKEVPVTPMWIKSVLYALIFLLFAFFIIAKFKVNRLKKDLKDQTDLHARSEKENREILAGFNADAVNVYGKSYLYRICGAPHGDYMGADNLPAAYYGSNQKWGEKYTFYWGGASTRKFHRYTCRFARSNSYVNAYTLKKYKHLCVPCSICNPEIPNMAWVEKYLIYIKFLGKYSVEPPTVDIKNEIEGNPMMGSITQEMLVDTALELGVSLKTALLIINQERKLHGIPELKATQFDL